MKIELLQLSPNDGSDIYDMLQELPKDENGFINGCNGKPYEDYKEWLKRSDNIANNIGLEDWMVPQNIYWMYVNDIPVGMGKLRHYLTDKLKEEGGHGGYAIRLSYRQKGYGTLLLKFLIGRAKDLGIEKLLMTVRNDNAASIKVALANNGVIAEINNERHYIWIDV